MPPPLLAELPERVEWVRVTVAPLNIPMPPPDAVATLPTRVELVTLIVPPVAEMPAENWDVFKEIVELLTVRIPPSLRIPPPAKPAVLPEMVEWVTERVPEFKKAPLLPVVFAPETVTPEILRLPPLAMVKILKSRLGLPLSPLMVSEEAPRPVMVKVPAVVVVAILSRADASVMV